MIRHSVRIVIALLIALAIWWIGPLISIGVYRPLGWQLLRQILVAIALIWGFWPSLQWLWSRLTATPRRFRKTSPPKAASESAPGKPDYVDDTLAQLERQLARSDGAPMPCYVLLGASGSGKSSLLAWALRDSVHPPVGIGQELGLDFRLGRDAVWLDTQGAWSLREGYDQDASANWDKLLAGLSALRGKLRVSGVVLCVDAGDLVSMAAKRRKQLAVAIRQRLLALRDGLGRHPGVYLALTGLDRLDGAVSMLSLMSPERWTRGIGFPLQMAGEGGKTEANTEWDGALQGLEGRVQSQVLFSAPQAGDIEANHAQLRFVETMGRLRQAVLGLLLPLFAPDAGGNGARLRGVWMGSVAEVADIEVDGPDASIRPLGELWNPLLQQVVLEGELMDRDLTEEARLAQEQPTQSAPQSRRRRALNALRWAAIPALSAMLLAWVAWGYFAERHYLEYVWAQFSEGKALAREQASGPPNTGSPLLAVAAQMRYAQAQAENAEQGLGTPYFEHRRVAETATDTYHRHLQKTLMPELYNEVKRTLLTQSEGSPGDIFLTLKVYLMLCRPQYRSADALERWISNRWEALSEGQYSDDDKHMLISDVRTLIALPGLPPAPEDANLVQAARAQAAQIPSVTRVLNHIRDQGLPAQVQNISLARAAGFGSAMSLRMRNGVPDTDMAVSGWYTRAGYTDVFLPRLEASARATLEEESWVLHNEPLKGNGFEVDGLVQKLADSARNQFLQDYISTWQNFLANVSVRAVTGLDDAAQLAAAMMNSQSPLANLVRFAGRETTLTGNYDGGMDSWIDRQKSRLEKGRRTVIGELSGEHYRTTLLPEHVVEEHFLPLRQLAKQLENNDDKGNNPLSRLFDTLYRQLGLVNGALQTGQMLPSQYDMFTKLRGDASLQPEPVRGVMLDLANSGSSSVSSQAQTLINRGAAGATRNVCDQGLTGRYPFRRGASMDAGVEDFERLFAPQGVMATYFREHLAPYVDTASRPWKARAMDGGKQTLVNSSVIRSYENASRIRDAMLDDGGRLRVPVVLRFLDMDPQLAEMQMDIAGQTLRFAHGATTPQRVDWNGQSQKLAIRLQMKSVDGRVNTLQYDGPWALFRFFDAGRNVGGLADRRERVYQGSLGAVRIEWQSLSSPSPLWSGLIQSFRCP
ncbi:type VI secretion system membrane subunit TssM [Chromobacterium sp. ATCC 53434]|uniref:type VI secretion system membrane subunit TssM n=1 Tax=Chromobacterium sp. (strain ATCC 53434 / SC 14030) TaxID=2059672 RepID=UPI000C7905D2|nr:type VI secretion system membrane subunit TssM [Chromobacterium sp. ATCC 53434]AUH51033.1 type VI secretion system membrane subunit TssM [Chromobacterium sp. ATCC 53434]